MYVIYVHFSDLYVEDHDHGRTSDFHYSWITAKITTHDDAETDLLTA